jgi:hypothetical protein
MLLAEPTGQVECEAFIPVGAAELMISLHREHRDPAVGQFDHRRIERSAAEVVDEDGLVGAS